MVNTNVINAFSLKIIHIFCFRFTPSMALEKLPQLKTVIDLTNTYRYYNPDVSCTCFYEIS